jgi:hypothetical protein
MLHAREAAMLVERDARIVNVEVIGEAYEIAACFLKQAGMIADSVLINERLLEIIHGLFMAGVRNRLLLANRAITKFEHSRPIPIR